MSYCNKNYLVHTKKKYNIKNSYNNVIYIYMQMNISYYSNNMCIICMLYCYVLIIRLLYL